MRTQMCARMSLLRQKTPENEFTCTVHVDRILYKRMRVADQGMWMRGGGGEPGHIGLRDRQALQTPMRTVQHPLPQRAQRMVQPLHKSRAVREDSPIGVDEHG